LERYQRRTPRLAGQAGEVASRLAAGPGQLAAVHFALSDEAFRGLRTVPDMASALVNNQFWDFWWD
jgi:hypothetical protein